MCRRLVTSDKHFKQRIHTSYIKNSATYFTIKVSDYAVLPALANFYVANCKSFNLERHIMHGT